MKLNFEIDSPTISSAYDVKENTEFFGDSTEVSQKLSMGIKAAQAGESAEARILLLEAAEAEPENEDAWLWLASISQYPEELLVFLNNVLNINPGNERALEWAAATKSMLAESFVRRGIDASKENRNNFAGQCFLQAIVHENENETAWLWLASISPEIEEKNAYLEKVLLINPENETALGSLEAVKKQMVEARLAQAFAEAFAGENASALAALEEILAQTPEDADALLLKSFLVESLDEKIACFEKVLELDSNNNVAQLNKAFLDSMKVKPSAEDEPEQEIEAGERHFEKAFSATESDGNSTLSDENEPAAFIEPKEETDFSAEEIYFTGEITEIGEPAAETEQSFGAPSPQESIDNAVPDFENNVEGEKSTGESPEESEESEENDFAETSLDLNDAEENILENFNAFNNFDADDGAETNSAPAESEAVENNDEDCEIFDVPDLETLLNEPADSDEFSKIYAEYETEESSLSGGETEELPAVEESLLSYYETEDELQASDSVQSIETESDSSSENTEEIEESAAAREEASFSIAVETEAEISSEQSAESLSRCPFCTAENGAQAFVCGSCGAMLSLSNLEMLLAYQNGDSDEVRGAVKRMETEKSAREFNADELKFLGIGEINLKHFRQGFDYLQQAVQKNPNDVVLGSQVNAFAIRLAEIEEQNAVHDSALKNKKILIVDDSATVRKLIADKLEKSGHEVFCAIDGMDALEKIDRIVPDLILLDIAMPRMDGYQVCKLIRGGEKTKDVPVIMISGKDGFFDKVRGRMAGTTGYMTKPFGPETLMKTIETYIIASRTDD